MDSEVIELTEESVAAWLLDLREALNDRGAS